MYGGSLYSAAIGDYLFKVAYARIFSNLRLYLCRSVSTVGGVGRSLEHCNENGRFFRSGIQHSKVTGTAGTLLLTVART